jgi:hypothetical protein
VLYLHTETAQAIKANMILPLFQCVELLKAIYACVHNRATLISAAVPKLIRALAHTAGTKLARAKQQRESSGQKLTPALLDQIAALHAALQALNGPGSSGRLLVARLSAALLPQEEVAWLWPALLRIETLAKFGPSLLAATDCSFLFYSKDLIGAYLRVIYQQPQLVDKLPVSHRSFDPSILLTNNHVPVSHGRTARHCAGVLSLRARAAQSVLGQFQEGGRSAAARGARGEIVSRN